jgi:DGQHR domain
LNNVYQLKELLRMITSNAMVSTVKCASLTEAEERAYMVAGRRNGRAFPAIAFSQGRRAMYSSAVPFTFVKDHIGSDSAAPRDSVDAVKGKINRPEDPKHSQSIATYLMDNINEKFILPPLTLNVQEPIKFYTYGAPEVADAQEDDLDFEEQPTKLGFLVIPPTVSFDTTDGQHRTSAIKKCFAALPRDVAAAFGNNSLSIMITTERDIAQVHQDFADAARTKGLPPSLLSVYDMRNPANGLVMDLIDNCRLFTDKIDSTSQRLSMKSLAVGLTNTVRQLVKELVGVGYAAGDSRFEAESKRLLKQRGTAEYDSTLHKCVEFIEYMTDRIPVWSKAANAHDVLELHQIPRFREQSVAMSTTGMVIIGRVGQMLLSRPEIDWHAYADKLAALDWNRSAAIWKNTVLSSDGKIQTAQPAVRSAVKAVCSAIELTFDEK